MTFNSDIEKTEAEIKVLQAKLELLKEIETHKSQPPRMNLQYTVKGEVVSYNDEVYYRLDFAGMNHNWYKKKTDNGVILVKITDGETHRLLEGLWFNEIRKGKYDEPYCPDEPEYYDEVEWDEKDTPNLQKIIDKMVEERKPKKLLNIIREWCDDDNQPTCEELVNRIEKWLPKEQSAAGSQNVNTELLVDGFNDCVRKMREMLR
jgi:hypothetical protein